MEHSTHGSGAGSAGAEPRALRGRPERGRTQRACAAVCRTRVRNARARAARLAAVLRARFCRTQHAVEPPAAPPAALGCSRAGWGVSGEQCSHPLFSRVYKPRSRRGIPALSLLSHSRHLIQAERWSPAYPHITRAPRWKWAAPPQKRHCAARVRSVIGVPDFWTLLCILTWRRVPQSGPHF